MKKATTQDDSWSIEEQLKAMACAPQVAELVDGGKPVAYRPRGTSAVWKIVNQQNHKFNFFTHEYQEARIEPFSGDELEEELGAALRHKITGIIGAITEVNAATGYLMVGSNSVSACDAAVSHEYMNGEPFGKFSGVIQV